jgi:predicted O-methyltransferase YrrM
MDEHGWNPGRLLEMSGSYWRVCALHASVKLGVFSVLGDEKLTGEDVARELNADGRAMTMLLNALTAMNLLSKIGGRYSNTAASRSFLVKDSPQYVGHMIMHHYHLMAAWSRLDEAVKTGKPVRTRASFDDEKVRESFLMGMFNMAMNLAPQLAKEIDLSGRRRLLDLGGGPGTYAIHFCMRNADLKATLYDLSTTRPFAERVIAQFGMTDRIDFVAGNYLQDAIGGAYDVVWLSHILHAEGPEECQTIVDKAVSALDPGGMILVHDFILNDAKEGPPFPALFSLNMLLGTERGRSYSEGEITAMLARAGVRRIQRLPFRGPTDSGIIRGIV